MPTHSAHTVAVRPAARGQGLTTAVIAGALLALLPLAAVISAGRVPERRIA